MMISTSSGGWQGRGGYCWRKESVGVCDGSGRFLTIHFNDKYNTYLVSIGVGSVYVLVVNISQNGHRCGGRGGDGELG